MVKVAKLHEKLGKPVPQVTSARQAQVKIVSTSVVTGKASSVVPFKSAGYLGGASASSDPAIASGSASISGTTGFKPGPGVGSSSTVAVPVTSALVSAGPGGNPLDGDDDQ